MKSKTSKYGRILNYLMAGNTISSEEAFDMFHATRLSAIIHTMRHRDNIPVESRTECSPGGAYYSRYFINPEFVRDYTI